MSEGILTESPNFWSGFTSGFIVLLVSDFADNTFVALSIFALKHGSTKILIPACIITVLTQFISVLIGEILTLFLPRSWLFIISALFFIAFGCIMLYEGFSHEKVLDTDSSMSSENENEVFVPPEKIAILSSEQSAPLLITPGEPKEEKKKKKDKQKRHIWIQMFFILCVGEMGDRSQLATIALTTTTNFWGIFAGGSLGLIFDVVLSVYIGDFMRNYISEYTASIIGGIMFIVMGVITGWTVFI